MEATYRWKPRSIHKVNAETAARALDDILARHGALTPRLVVEESRPEDAPLHPEFEWDDHAAAELYREYQARYIIQSVTVRMPEKQEPTYIRAYVSVQPPVAAPAAASPNGKVSGEEPAQVEAKPVFVRTFDALRDPVLRRQVLERAMREMDDWCRRYSELEELARVFESARVVKAQLGLQPVA